jgi:NitT/TauT family transport system substrate-binding protein
LIRNDDHNAAFAGLADGQVDAVAGSLQDIVLFAEPGEEPLQCVLALDDSRGADGVAANKDIRSIADLKGKRVAVAVDSSMQFYLNLLLREAGLSEADLGEVVDLWGDEAAEAFLLREVDAAVTWEPDLTPAKNAPHGHLLFDTSERPGLVVDCLLTTADILSDHQAAFRALGRAWDAAVDFIDAHPDEANRIIARYFGGALEDPSGCRRELERRPPLRRRGESSVFRRAGPPGSDLRDDATHHRCLVEPRQAQSCHRTRRRDLS